MDRRKFFTYAGNAALLAGGGGAFALLSARSTNAASRVKSDSRLKHAYQLREQLARTHGNSPVPDHPLNGDEQRYENLIASYSKGLPHDGLGQVDRKAYRQLLRALASGRKQDFDAVTLGGPVRLVNPQAVFSCQLQGVEPPQLGIAPPPEFASEEQGAEAAELYWHALARDIPFSQYGREPITQAAIADLRGFERFKGIDDSALFRGETAGDRRGPYLSQFLCITIPHGAQQIIQKYNSPLAGQDFMHDLDTCLQQQSGALPRSRITHATATRYIRTGRDLGEWVHTDYAFQAFLNAALILMSYGDDALKPDHPYRDSLNQSGAVTLGGPELLALVAQASHCALKAAWYQKWLLHRRLRPEEFGLRLQQSLARRLEAPIHPKLLNSDALRRVYDATGAYLLPQAYPEGCPTHPAYPAGHATIAGACITVLKAYFDENFVIPNPVEAYDNGFSMRAYRDDDLTIGDELNKLASNISIGRDFAGLHWRSDAVAGNRLGEQVALELLADYRHVYNEEYSFSLTLMDGTKVEV